MSDFLDGAALAEESGGEGEVSDAGVVRVGAGERIDAFLLLAEEVEEAGQAGLGEGDYLLAQVDLGDSECTREERQGPSRWFSPRAASLIASARSYSRSALA